MAENLTRKIIRQHLVEGGMTPGEPIALHIDQTLTQDATGTTVMLELEAMGLDRAKTDVSVQYVDHNLIQADFRNADDHRFLYSAAQRWGLWYSRPGNGVSHPLHQERFGVPGRTLLGSDSHTPAAGAIGMLAMGAGGLDVAAAIAGEPYRLAMPRIWGVELVGILPEWVSAKDVILEMLRRHDVSGGVGYVIEYYGDGLASLSAMDRHVIANMGAELGATSTVFPSDHATYAFLESQGRSNDWIELEADHGCDYDRYERIDLSALEPLIAMPSSPGNVVTVREVAGEPIYQAYIGSSANPGYRDFAIAAEIVRGRRVADTVSFDVNPTSRQTLENLTRDSRLGALLAAGARLHQAGCNGCIGMGQAPATDQISLRTVPRNFPGRSGTREDKVCLVSPETAAASALSGRITDPRTLDRPYPRVADPADPIIDTSQFTAPPPARDAAHVALDKGPNIVSLPEFDELPDRLALTVALKVGDDISTDEILPAGLRALPLRSNIPAISAFAFEGVDGDYHRRAQAISAGDGHALIAGANYGQGSSREHAALALRYLGLRLVVARSFARIHRQNLVNFGVLPLIFADAADFGALEIGDTLTIANLDAALDDGAGPELRCGARDLNIATAHDLAPREIEVIRAGGWINRFALQAAS